MSYRVRPTTAALEDVVAIGQWIATQGAPTAAERWAARLMKALWSLDQMLERCPVAPEDDEFEAEIRQLIVGQYRVLLTVRGSEVFVFHVRHGRRRYATVKDVAAALEEMEETEP